MRRIGAVLFVSACIACAPGFAFADTIVDSDIAEDTTWTKEGSPYLVENSFAISEGATLTIEPCVEVRMVNRSEWYERGGLMVFGQLRVVGTESEPVMFTSSDGNLWNGIYFENPNAASSLSYVNISRAANGIVDLYSKDLVLSAVRIEDGEYGIEAAGSRLSIDGLSVENMSREALDIRDGSDVTLKNLALKNVGDSIQVYVNSAADISNLRVDGADSEALAVYVGSRVRVASSTIKNISRSYGAVEAFIDSSLDITGLTLENVSGGEAFSVFLNSTIDIRDSVVRNTDSSDAASAFNGGRITAQNLQLDGGTGDAFNLYHGGTIDLRDSAIAGFSGAGVAVYIRSDEPIATLSITKSEIRDTAIGLLLYADNAAFSFSNNSIHDNAQNGLESFGTSPIDASNNWWGDASGPRADPDNPAGLGNGILVAEGAGAVTFSPWLAADPFALDPCATPGACASNVLFLPGIEGSRLYEGAGCGGTEEEKLWEPVGSSILESIWDVITRSGDAHMKRLYLTEDGKSACSGIYTKEGDIIDSAGGEVYESFIAAMNTLQEDGTIADWKPVAYDWRLSFADLLHNGAKRDGKIYYDEATSTPYIEQTLRALAGNSKTKKVTVVAHSNGGLLAKALLDQLGGSTAKSLVDKVVLVGAPQSGAPESLGAMLVGYNAGMYVAGIPVVSNNIARIFTQNSPMAYHLLPSQDYFDSVMDDSDHPVARFAGDAYTRESEQFGNAIGTWDELRDFLLLSDMNAPLVEYAKQAHDSLDTWVPPEGIEVTQIAGWGADTVAGIDYYTPPATDAVTALSPIRAYRPIFTEDGDGVVPVPSALMMATSTGVSRYWVDLHAYNLETNSGRKHKDLFGIQPLEDFVRNIITNNESYLPAYILTKQPPSTSDKKLIFYLHSPLTLELTDTLGNTTGLASDGTTAEGIPGSIYGEFGEVKYIIAPEGEYQLSLHGQASGTFALDIQESVNGAITASSTVANIPTTANTLASLTVSGGISSISPLTVDEDGDGESDLTITPREGAYVNYAPAPPITHSGGGHFTPVSIPAATKIIENISTTTSTTTPTTIYARQQAVFQKKQVEIAIKKSTLVQTKEASLPPQTASAYQASQQSVSKSLIAAVYNGLRTIWSVIKTFFSL